MKCARYRRDVPSRVGLLDLDVIAAVGAERYARATAGRPVRAIVGRVLPAGRAFEAAYGDRTIAGHTVGSAAAGIVDESGRWCCGCGCIKSERQRARCIRCISCRIGLANINAVGAVARQRDAVACPHRKALAAIEVVFPGRAGFQAGDCDCAVVGEMIAVAHAAVGGQRHGRGGRSRRVEHHVQGRRRR